MIKEIFSIIIYRSFDHYVADLDHYPTEDEISDILSKEEDGSYLKVEHKYKLVNKDKTQ